MLNFSKKKKSIKIFPDGCILFYNLTLPSNLLKLRHYKKDFRNYQLKNKNQKKYLKKFEFEENRKYRQKFI